MARSGVGQVVGVGRADVLRNDDVRVFVAAVALAVMLLKFRPENLAEEEVYRVAAERGQLTVTCTALALAVPLPESAEGARGGVPARPAQRWSCST